MVVSELSWLLGNLAEFYLSPPKAMSAASVGVLFHRFNEGADMWLADLPQTVTAASHPVIFLGYWHYRLLNYLLIPSSLSTDILWTAQEAFTLLTAEPFFLSPFTHHFTCLAGL